MKREFRNPIWKNGEKSAIVCKIAIIDDDGKETLHNGEVSKYGDGENINPDWNTLMEEFGAEKIDTLTEEFDKAREEELKTEEKVNEEEVTRREKRKEQEKLFAKKLEIFEIPSIKESKNRAAKSKIRKAKSEVEAVVHAAKMMIEDEQTADDEE